MDAPIAISMKPDHYSQSNLNPRIMDIVDSNYAHHLAIVQECPLLGNQEHGVYTIHTLTSPGSILLLYSKCTDNCQREAMSCHCIPFHTTTNGGLTLFPSYTPCNHIASMLTAAIIFLMHPNNHNLCVNSIGT